MINRVVRLFLDTDMRNQHQGLMELAKKQSVDIAKLAVVEHVVFVNASLNRVKICSKGNVLSYLFRDKGQIDMQAFKEIASAFGEDGSINFDRALKESLVKRLAKKEKKKA